MVGAATMVVGIIVVVIMLARVATLRATLKQCKGAIVAKIFLGKVGIYGLFQS